MVAECPRRKLLVVDDEPLVRQTLSLCLRDEYEVTTVASGEEAIEASRREDYPVVLLDLCLEGISGIETLKRLKKIREIQNVIILTAYQSMESAISALNSGAFNYLTKPFERAHLKEVVARGFESYEQQNLRKQEMQHRLMSVHDSFFSLLCHEFNTPLNIILGFSELLSHSLKNPEHLAWVEDIKESGAHLHDILMEIVDYIGASHLAAAGIEKEFVPGVLLHPMIQVFGDKDVEVEIKNSPALNQRLLGPATSIFMITRKLVRMATHQSRRIRVVPRIDSVDAVGNACLRVVVTGTGIHRDLVGKTAVDRIFEPYQFTFGGGGGCRTSLGLELATCRKIAEYADGSVDCFFSPEGELDFAAKIPVKLIG